MDCHASALPSPPPPRPPHLRLPHSFDKESQFGCQGNRLFFHGDVGARGKGRAALFRPMMKDPPHACLIVRLMAPNPTAQPIYHRLIMLSEASDTVISPVLSRRVAPATPSRAIVAMRSWWAQLRPQIVRSNKEGTHASIKEGHAWPNKHGDFTHPHDRAHTPYFVSFLYIGTNLWLSAAGGGKKMADHHSNSVCRSATAVMYVVTLLTLRWTLYHRKTVTPYCVQHIGSVDSKRPGHRPLSDAFLHLMRQDFGCIL